MKTMMHRVSQKKTRIAAKPLLLVMVCVLCGWLLISLQGGIQWGWPPQINGYRLYRVVGSSMEPTFASGALLVVQSVDPATIKPNTIITYRCARSIVAVTTHRVKTVEKLPAGGISFVTRGDGNPVADPYPVCECELIGVVRWVVAVPGSPSLPPYLSHMAGLGMVMAGMYFIRILHQHHGNQLKNHVMH